MKKKNKTHIMLYLVMFFNCIICANTKDDMFRVKKQMNIHGQEWDLSGTYNTNTACIEIGRFSCEKGDKQSLVNLKMSNVSTGSWDYAISEDTNILWIVVQRIHPNAFPKIHQGYSRVYPLKLNNGKYEYVKNKYDKIVSLNLSNLLQSYINQMYKSGKSLDLPKRPAPVKINYHISCSNSTAIVDVNLNNKYEFNLNVELGKEQRLYVRKFKFNELEEKE